jgi:hypothetical protein
MSTYIGMIADGGGVAGFESGDKIACVSLQEL